MWMKLESFCLPKDINSYACLLFVSHKNNVRLSLSQEIPEEAKRFYIQEAFGAPFPLRLSKEKAD